MICMPTGRRPSLPAGAHTKGSPAKEIDCVSIPVFARTGSSRPRTTEVSSPMRCAELARLAGAIWGSG